MAACGPDDGARHRYFQQLAAHGRDVLDRLPICAEIRSIAQTFAILQPAIEAIRPAELRALAALPRPQAGLDEGHAAGPVGMNSVGILADRLTILTCKSWYLRHRQRAPAEAELLVGQQIADVVWCLALVRPGPPGLLAKLGSPAVETRTESFVAAYFDLLAANLLMWETQELLYTRDMEAVPAEELRDYIRFFSQANLRRNKHIVDIERLYWATAPAAMG
jgi:hypothetical protein